MFVCINTSKLEMYLHGFMMGHFFPFYNNKPFKIKIIQYLREYCSLEHYHLLKVNRCYSVFYMSLNL